MTARRAAPWVFCLFLAELLASIDRQTHTQKIEGRKLSSTLLSSKLSSVLWLKEERPTAHVNGPLIYGQREKVAEVDGVGDRTIQTGLAGRAKCREDSHLHKIYARHFRRILSGNHW